MKDKLIELKNISKTFGSGHSAVHAVQDVSFSVAPGDLILIKGPSGSGKTTLLTIIGLMLSPTKGSITSNGKDISKLSDKEKSRFRLKNIGFVFQSFNLLPALRSWENVAVPKKLANDGSKLKPRAVALMQKLEIQQRSEHLPSQLSGGERQRVAIARALMNDAMIILADEPTANLDSKTGKKVTESLCRVACEENKAVIIVSHDQRIEEAVRKIMIIEDGKIVSTRSGGHDQYCKRRHKNTHTSGKTALRAGKEPAKDTGKVQ